MFPRLKFLGFSDDPAHLNLDLILAVAPRLDHIYISFSRSPGLGERSALLFHDREFRLFVHASFAHVHRWPGPRSGAELVALWQRRMEICCDVAAGRRIFRTDRNCEMFTVVERRGAQTYSTGMELDEIATTSNLHALDMQVCDDWWKPREVADEA